MRSYLFVNLKSIQMHVKLMYVITSSICVGLFGSGDKVVDIAKPTSFFPSGILIFVSGYSSGQKDVNSPKLSIYFSSASWNLMIRYGPHS